MSKSICGNDFVFACKTFRDLYLEKPDIDGPSMLINDQEFIVNNQEIGNTILQELRANDLLSKAQFKRLNKTWKLYWREYKAELKKIKVKKQTADFKAAGSKNEGMTSHSGDDE